MNRLTCCPPGSLKPANGTHHLVVASMMRSGTHILIDLLLNNFIEYKGLPLYVNLDMFVHKRGSIYDLEKSGGFIIKTHFPQSVECLGYEEQFANFFTSNKVILVSRDSQDIKRSLGNFGSWGAAAVGDFDTKHHEFLDYWDNQHPGSLLRLNYSDLIDSSKLLEIMTKIESFTGLTRGEKLVGVIPKKSRCKIFFCKATTRLLGRYAPRINTGIKLGS